MIKYLLPRAQKKNHLNVNNITDTISMTTNHNATNLNNGRPPTKNGAN